ncbi:HU domain-containing protein [Larkinella soli]|uniref:HU domain-containing protein n=1 Tax=Larkinella soli TaxID=1770527 RepID=UPI000FFB2DCF|nr:SPOR domain-containing protein [Larkinella soli]
MVAVSDYLKKLLYQYDCIVVPELGGFILHSVPATFSESSGQYFPPRKKIAFNEALKLDDGLLVNYMMLHEELTREEVLQGVRAFVEELKQQLRTQGSFAVEGVGLFSENEEGKLQFDPELRHNFQGESYGFQAIEAHLASVTEPIAELPVEELEPLEEVLVPAETAEPLVRKMPVSTGRNYLQWAAAILVIGSLGVMSFMTVNRSTSQAFSSLNPFEVFMNREEAAPAPVEKPVAKAEVSPEKVSPALPPASVEAAPAPVVAPVPAPVTTSNPVDAVKPVLTTASPDFQYMAIAGSFASKRNAKRLVRSLYRKGFTSAFILPTVRKGELIKVAALGSNDREEVLASLGAIAKYSGSRPWIMKKH